MRTITGVSAALLILLTAARAQPAAVPADAPPDVPKSVKIICVRGQAETGSHFGTQKVCHTQAEWDSIHSQSERTLQRYETIQNTQPGSGR